MSKDEPLQNRDWWNPEPGDPYWMLEVRQGFEDAGAWLRNKYSFLTTREASEALRFPSRWHADVACRDLPGNYSGQFEPTEHVDIDIVGVPDESLTLIESQEAEIAALREALEQIIIAHERDGRCASDLVGIAARVMEGKDG